MSTEISRPTQAHWHVARRERGGLSGAGERVDSSVGGNFDRNEHRVGSYEASALAYVQRQLAGPGPPPRPPLLLTAATAASCWGGVLFALTRSRAGTVAVAVDVGAGTVAAALGSPVPLAPFHDGYRAGVALHATCGPFLAAGGALAVVAATVVAIRSRRKLGHWPRKSVEPPSVADANGRATGACAPGGPVMRAR